MVGAWLGFCIIVGFIAYLNGGKFWLYFLVSVFTSPLGGFILMLVKLKPWGLDSYLGNTTDELEKYRKMLKAGKITRSQYEEIKRKYLTDQSKK